MDLSHKPPPTVNIVVLGASYAGLLLTHSLLRTTLPTLRTTPTAPLYKVILIAPNTEFYWNIAAPRALCSADLVDDDKLFVPFLQSFEEYSENEFEFIQGRAVRFGHVHQILDVEVLGGRGIRGRAEIGRVRQIEYHAIIVATGTSANCDLLSLHGQSEHTRGALNRFRGELRTATSVIIVGGGPSGVECAGQIATWINEGERKQLREEASMYKKKRRKDSSCGFRKPSSALYQTPINVILISGHKRLLPEAKPSVGDKAERQLKELGVNVMHGVRLISAQELPSRTTRCILTQDISITCDLFIPATGVKPNTQFIPTEFLDASGYVIVDEHLRMAKVGRHAFAVGSCCSFDKKSVLDIPKSVQILLHNLRNDLIDWEAKVQFPFSGYEKRIEELEDRVFEPIRRDTLLCPITRWGGAGVFRDRNIPSLAVWWLKGRDYNIGKAKRIACNGQ